VIGSLGIKHLEIRGVYEKRVLELNEEEVKKAKETLEERNFKISAIGSPIGKIKITDDFSTDLGNLKKAFTLAHTFETKYIRMFSYYLPEGKAPSSHGEEVLRRVGEMARLAEKEGIILLCENEGDVYCDTTERCLEILGNVNSPCLRLTFDPANFVVAGVKPYTEAFPELADYIEYLHIKDARFLDKAVVPAGEGDGEIKEILKALKERNFDGFLSLEPHLAVAGEKGGFSGAELFGKATQALKKILEEICV
jgi:sugar phosphate isomerase/epimerase